MGVRTCPHNPLGSLKSLNINLTRCRLYSPFFLFHYSCESQNKKSFLKSSPPFITFSFNQHPWSLNNERLCLGQCLLLSHLSCLGLTQLKVYHLTEMTQWQLDRDQDISSVNTQTLEQKSSVFAGHALAWWFFLLLFVFRSFGFTAFCYTWEMTHLL